MDRAGIDVVFQGESGMISITGHPGDPPQKTATTIGDDAWPLPDIATAIVAARRWCRPPGRGGGTRLADRGPVGDGTPSTLQTAPSRPAPDTVSPYLAPNQVLATADGHMTLAVTSDRHFAVLCEVIDRPDLAGAYPGNEERMAARTTACRRVGNGLPNPSSTAEWVDLLVGAGDLPGECSPCPCLRRPQKFATN